MSSGFCPAEWEPCWRGCPPGTCLAHDVSRDGPDPAEFEEWRDAMEADLLRTLLGTAAIVTAPAPDRRASTAAEAAGGTLPT